MKQAFYPLHKQNIVRAWQQENTSLQTFRSVPDCQTCMCKRGIMQPIFTCTVRTDFDVTGCLQNQHYFQRVYCIHCNTSVIVFT